MTYKDFYRLAQYANDNWKGCLSNEEIADNARIFYEEYNEDGCAGNNIQSMLEQLFEDGSDEALEFIAELTNKIQDKADFIEDMIEDTDNINYLAEIIEKCDKLTFYGYGDKAYEKINEIRGDR